jgi:hypothetical protein
VEYADRQYRITSDWGNFDTAKDEFLGFLPVFNDTTELYRHGEELYYILSFFANVERKPAFTVMNKWIGEAWQRGIDKYWEVHNADM